MPDLNGSFAIAIQVAAVFTGVGGVGAIVWGIATTASKRHLSEHVVMCNQEGALHQLREEIGKAIDKGQDSRHEAEKRLEALITANHADSGARYAAIESKFGAVKTAFDHTSTYINDLAVTVARLEERLGNGAHKGQKGENG